MALAEDVGIVMTPGAGVFKPAIRKETARFWAFIVRYSTAHVQVYKKMRVMIRASRNFAFNSRVGLVQHERILLASDN